MADSSIVMFLETSSKYEELVTLAEKCLRELPLVFQKNATDRVTEFEVVRPVYFRILVESNKIPKTWNFLMPSISPPVGSTMEISFGIDSNSENEVAATENSRIFLRALVKAMPTEPWKGLPARDSAREEKKWKELLQSSAN